MCIKPSLGLVYDVGMPRPYPRRIRGESAFCTCRILWRYVDFFDSVEREGKRYRPLRGAGVRDTGLSAGRGKIVNPPLRGAGVREESNKMLPNPT